MANYREPQWLLPNEKNLQYPDSKATQGSGLTEDRHSLYSMDFDSNNYISCETITQLGNLTQATWSGWFNRGTSSGSHYIMGSWGTSGTERQFLVLQTPTALTVFMGLGQYGNQRTMFQNTSLTFTTGEWYHLAFVYDESETSNADKMKVYINGGLQINQSAGAAINFVNPVTSPFIIGTIGGYLTNKFLGKIDEVAIFPRALSFNEVNTLWNNGAPSNPMLLSGKPVAYYPLGEQARKPGTAEWRFPNEVLQGQAIDFTNSSNDSISSDVNITGNWSVSMWVNTDSTSYQTALQLSSQATTGTQDSIIFVRNTFESNKWGFYDGSTVLLGSVLDINKWHNLLLTKNGTTYTIFLNGTQEGQSTKLNINITDLLIGRRSYNGFFFDGQISNVAIWNSDQSANIANIYNYGAPQTSYTVTPTAWYKLDKTSKFTGLNPNWHSALEFVASESDYIDLGSSPTIFTDFTLSFWYKQRGAAGSFEAVVGKDTIDGGILTSIVFTSGLLHFKNRPGSWTALTTTTASNTEFKHYSITYDSSANELKGYCNGILEVTTTPVFSGATGNEHSFNRIGRYGTIYYLDGQLSNLAAFNQVISAEDIKYLYNGGTPQTNISFEPVSWWKLDNLTTGIQDSGSASNNGTNNGATEVTDSVAVDEWVFENTVQSQTPNWSSVLDFDSSTASYINIGTDSSLNFTTAMTFSCWARIDGASGGVYALAANMQASPYKFNFRYYYAPVAASRSLILQYANGSGALQRFDVYSDLIDDNWHHLAFTIDGTTNADGISIYIDNVKTSFTATGTNIQSFASTTLIGAYQTTTTWDFEGPISNAAFWDSSLSTSQINDLYNNGQPEAVISHSPLSYYKLDNTTTGVQDSGSASNNGTIVGTIPEIQTNVWTPRLNADSDTLPSTALVSSDLQFNSAYSSFSLDFDGMNDYVDCGAVSQIPSATALTVSCWLNANSITTNQVVWADNSSAYIFSFEFAGTVNKMYFEYAPGYAAIDLNSVITVGSWHNVVMVYDASGSTNTDKIKFYIDGVDKSSSITYTGAIPSSLSASIGDFLIGHGTAYNKYFNGNIDELSIFNKALNQAEITSIYNNGYPKDITALAPVSWWRLGEDAYFNGTDFIVPNQITGAPNGTSDNMTATDLVADAPGSYAAGLGSSLALADRVGDAPNSTANSLSFNMTPENRISYPAGYVPTQVDNVYTMNFDAASSAYIDTGSTPSDLNFPATTVTNSDFSVSFWYYFDVNQNYDPIIQATVSATNGFGIWQSSTNTSSLNFWVGHYSGSPLYTTQLTAQTWYHIACVFEGGSTYTQKIYVNGVENNTASRTTSRVIHSGENCLIGGQGFQSRYFDGKLDEFAIFDYALSARQIKQDIYNATTSGKTADLNNISNLTAPVAWYRMGD